MGRRWTQTALAAIVLIGVGSGCHRNSIRGVEGGIGDDICAVMLNVNAYVTDSMGAPVADAQVWRVDEPRLEPPEPTRAELLGVTDSQGRLTVPLCYMGSSEFRLWNPERDPVRLVFMIVRQGYGPERVDLRPPVGEVLAAGNLLGVPPGQLANAEKLRPDPRWRERRYVVSVNVRLAPVAR